MVKFLASTAWASRQCATQWSVPFLQIFLDYKQDVFVKNTKGSGRHLHVLLANEHIYTCSGTYAIHSLLHVPIRLANKHVQFTAFFIKLLAHKHVQFTTFFIMLLAHKHMQFTTFFIMLLAHKHVQFTYCPETYMQFIAFFMSYLPTDTCNSWLSSCATCQCELLANEHILMDFKNATLG